METEVVWALLGVVVALLGVAVAYIGVQRRNGKNGNPSTSAHLVKLETLGEQQVRALEQMSTELTAIQVTLGKLETTVGSCGAVQALGQRGGE